MSNQTREEYQRFAVSESLDILPVCFLLFQHDCLWEISKKLICDLQIVY
jgi:hypothetical protein